MLSFEFDGRKHAVSSVFTFWVVEEFDAIKVVTSGIVACVACPMPDAFAFQQVEKVLGKGVVHWLAGRFRPENDDSSATAHTMFQVVMI